MRKFADRLRRSERGFTLIELIATVTLLAMASAAVYGVIHLGFSTYNKIKVENSLRDEGDLIMSTIIAQLYDEGADSIRQVNGGIQLTGQAGVSTIEIQDEQLVVGGAGLRTVETQSRIADGSEIRLVCKPAAGECASGQIEIKLHLVQQYGSREQDLELESRFGF